MFLFNYCRKYQDKLHMVLAVKELLNHPVKEENLVDRMYFMSCTDKGEGSVVQVPPQSSSGALSLQGKKISQT